MAKKQSKAKPVKQVKRTSIATATRASVQCDSLVTAIKGLERAIPLLETASRSLDKKVKTYVAIAATNLAEHVRLSEGEDGLLTHVDTDRPHLARWAGALRKEHGELKRLLSRLETAVGAGGTLTEKKLEAMRGLAHRLLAALREHQDQGTELVFQAYVADIGTKD